ncbi:MAG: DUF2007 domain-containing protein [Bacteroidales bacterium]|nr:DUF2007 domain-containing protein [Bacteroidales bacterium]
MENEWVSIFITSDQFYAELAKGLLEENNIEAVVVNKQDSFYHFGEIELYVKRDNIVKAKFLLKEL